MTRDMASALEGIGLSLFWGQDASAQPGCCADMFLHETAVAWIRLKLLTTTPKGPWLESREQYVARLRQIIAAINRDHAAGGLCNKFPGRLDELIRCQGDRLRS